MEKKRIFVVDDEPDFLNMIKIRLEANDFNVDIFDNGLELLERLKKDKPDAILLDILMPNLDGLTALKRIRKEYKDLPVFIITAFSNKERFELAKKLSASGFIVKTGDLKREVENITNILRVADKFHNSRQ
ncbi:MAG: response regulator [Candidatus Omnitrophota bacterium]